eukprot:746273-Hanusia_phi.AAC.4
MPPIPSAELVRTIPAMQGRCSGRLQGNILADDVTFAQRMKAAGVTGVVNVQTQKDIMQRMVERQ